MSIGDLRTHEPPAARSRPSVAAAETTIEEQSTPEPRQRPSLRTILVTLDLVTVLVAWAVTLLIGRGHGTLRSVAHVAIVSIVSMLVIASQRLYLARVCGVRAVEIARIGRASALAALFAYMVAGALGSEISVARAVMGGVITFALLSIERELYGAWLKRGRTQGRFVRPVVLLGTNDEAFELYRLLDTHPELGFRVAGIVGSRAAVISWNADVPWLGELDAAAALKTAHANGVIVATSALTSDELNLITRQLLRAGAHIHLSSGLRGVDHRRLRALPFAHEPLFYLERVSLAKWQLWTKKAIDLLLAGIGMIFAAPVLLLAALAIKLQDRGPVMFRQVRIGRDGKPFTVLKLRTMVPDADKLLPAVHDINERRGGPLFKNEDDPRRTRVGRFLEATSIDELPQLVNVLRGNMSMVGPRPALPEETEQFDEELMMRHSVPPGITGLWQVEARDNPAFDAYRRLDLFYVENWSVSLDLAILWATFQAIIGRLLLRRKQDEQARDTAAEAAEVAASEEAAAEPHPV